jgi:hypothetical protein
MLKSINKRYIIFGTFIYLLIAAVFPIELKVLYVLNYFSLLSFFLGVDFLAKKPEDYFTRRKMIPLIFCYSLFFVFCYNLLSYYYTDNFYVFSESDAILYHNESIVMSGMNFIGGIEYYLSRHELEDLGIVLVLSTLYKIYATKLLLNLFYVFIAVITANAMYAIARRFMSVKYAWLCAASYCLASYVIWFHASGLKESILVMLIALFYSNYYRFVFDKKRAGVWGLILVPLLLFLFRPVLSIFCLVSIAMGILLKRKFSAPQLFFVFAALFAGIYFLEAIMSSTDKFLLGGTDRMLEIKEMEGMVKGGIPFTYLVNILSSMFGNFPSLLSSKVHLTFYSPGLIFKVFISIGFWFGVIHIVKERMSKTYPMLVFILAEMVSLIYILEALELRKSIPHFPLVYIIAFIFIYKYDHNQLISIKNHLFYKKSFNAISLVLCILMVYWNFR